MNHEDLEYFMREAMLEGRKALPKCFPNPPVGCVIVKEGMIISRGHTHEPGKHHAEAMALASLTGNDDGLSMFVTLEPCSFHGRTPSCAEAIVRNNIKWVYVGIIDPHPKNMGAGIQILQKAGIHVNVGILAYEIQEEIGVYLSI